MPKKSVPFLVSAATVLAAFAPSARADAVHEEQPAPVYRPSNKEGFSLFNPTPVELMRDMNTDRPDTTESPITVDAGHFQIETSFFDFTTDKSQGVRTETWIIGQTNLKVGLLDRTDLQFIIDPYTVSKTTGGGASTTANGISDLTVRLKQNLWGDDGETKTAFAVMPWISAPTGSNDLSADKYQGGLILPGSVQLSETVGLSAMLEADVLWNAGTGKYYVEWTHSISCGIAITEDLGMYVEYVGQHDSGTASNYRMFGDIGCTYALNKNLILDAGVRIGLNKRADDFGGFTGISYRY